MRKVAVIFFSMLIASAALAQQKNEFNVFVTAPGLWGARAEGTHGLGVAFDRMVTPRVSAQLAVGYEHHRTYSYFVTPGGGFQQTNSLPFETFPIDLTARYHFLTENRWKPYVGLGLRYVRRPNVPPLFNYQNHIGPEILGGTSFQMTKSFGLVLDGKVYLGDREAYDSQWKPSFGLLWRF